MTDLRTRITVIVDNISNMGIPGEWGLSILVEYADQKILVDTGASDLFLKNMEKLGIDVKDIDYATLEPFYNATGSSRGNIGFQLFGRKNIASGISLFSKCRAYSFCIRYGTGRLSHHYT